LITPKGEDQSSNGIKRKGTVYVGEDEQKKEQKEERMVGGKSANRTEE